jgi:hypothetical protein
MKQFTIENVTANIRRVTFANPPVNLARLPAIGKLAAEVGVEEF